MGSIALALTLLQGGYTKCPPWCEAWGSGCPWNSTPSGMFLCPSFTPMMVRTALARSPLQWRLRRCCTPNACVRPSQTRGLSPGPSFCCRPTTRAHHRSHPGKLSVLNASALAGCPSMEWQSIDQMWQSDVVLALVPNLGNLVPVAPQPSVANPFSGPCHLLGFGVDWYPTSMRGLLGVKDIAAPEVKFLDRCKINCSEGVLHLPVRRSRMRVWGAKMIRHRRSPPL